MLYPPTFAVTAASSMLVSVRVKVTAKLALNWFATLFEELQSALLVSPAAGPQFLCPIPALSEAVVVHCHLQKR